MAFTKEPTVYVASTDMHYGTGDVHSFHVAPGSGDVILHFNHTGMAFTARIFVDDWSSFVKTVQEEHAAMGKDKS
jgi:hypothetical protein